MFPGTALNLVVGPNGAGKSTIVGAMVLGLGFPLKIKNRYMSVADWIRNGEEVDELEVDLNRPNTEKELVTIRRRMTRSTGVSPFWIDDVQKKEKEVLAFVRGLDCQLDNLCHFLPQEMVNCLPPAGGRIRSQGNKCTYGAIKGN